MKSGWDTYLLDLSSQSGSSLVDQDESFTINAQKPVSIPMCVFLGMESCSVIAKGRFVWCPFPFLTQVVTQWFANAIQDSKLISGLTLEVNIIVTLSRPSFKAALSKTTKHHAHRNGDLQVPNPAGYEF